MKIVEPKVPNRELWYNFSIYCIDFGRSIDIIFLFNIHEPEKSNFFYQIILKRKKHDHELNTTHKNMKKKKTILQWVALV